MLVKDLDCCSRSAAKASIVPKQTDQSQFPDFYMPHNTKDGVHFVLQRSPVQ